MENILKAIAIAKKEIPNIKLTVIGDVREDSKDLINNLNIESNIDYKEELSKQGIEFLNEADIGISASLYEGLLSFVEMISSELPVIVASRVHYQSLQEILELFLMPKEHQVWQKMIELASNHDLRNELKDQSKLRRGDFFDLGRVCYQARKPLPEIIHGNF